MTNLVPFPKLVENRLFVERINRGHHRESFRGESHLSELLARVEAGEEVIIAPGNDPVARLSRIRKETIYSCWSTKCALPVPGWRRIA